MCDVGEGRAGQADLAPRPAKTLVDPTTRKAGWECGWVRIRAENARERILKRTALTKQYNTRQHVTTQHGPRERVQNNTTRDST